MEQKAGLLKKVGELLQPSSCEGCQHTACATGPPRLTCGLWKKLHPSSSEFHVGSKRGVRGHYPASV